MNQIAENARKKSVHAKECAQKRVHLCEKKEIEQIYSKKAEKWKVFDIY